MVAIIEVTIFFIPNLHHPTAWFFRWLPLLHPNAPPCAPFGRGQNESRGLEVCRMVRCPFKKGLFLQSVCDDTRGLLPPLARSPSLPEGGLMLSRRYLLFERRHGLSFPLAVPDFVRLSTTHFLVEAYHS